MIISKSDQASKDFSHQKPCIYSKTGDEIIKKQINQERLSQSTKFAEMTFQETELLPSQEEITLWVSETRDSFWLQECQDFVSFLLLTAKQKEYN